jgi:hypothetical protein
VTPDDTELVADLHELSHRSLVAGRGGDRIESLSTQVEALAKERDAARICLASSENEPEGHNIFYWRNLYHTETARTASLRGKLDAERDLHTDTKAALAVERAHSGELDVRIAGLEVERDAARLGAADLIEQKNSLTAELRANAHMLAVQTDAARQADVESARERTAREQAEALMVQLQDDIDSDPAEQRAERFAAEASNLTLRLMKAEATVARLRALLVEAANVFRGVLTSPLPLTPGSRDSMVLWLAEVEAELAPAPPETETALPIQDCCCGHLVYHHHFPIDGQRGPCGVCACPRYVPAPGQE